MAARCYAECCADQGFLLNNSRFGGVGELRTLALATLAGGIGRAARFGSAQPRYPVWQALDVDLASNTAFLAIVFMGIPFAFTLDIDRRAVDQQVQRTLRPPMRDIHGQCLLATAERVAVEPLAQQQGHGRRQSCQAGQQIKDQRAPGKERGRGQSGSPQPVRLKPDALHRPDQPSHRSAKSHRSIPCQADRQRHPLQRAAQGPCTSQR
jgi:hypothetical protein